MNAQTLNNHALLRVEYIGFNHSCRAISDFPNLARDLIGGSSLINVADDSNAIFMRLVGKALPQMPNDRLAWVVDGLQAEIEDKCHRNAELVNGIARLIASDGESGALYADKGENLTRLFGLAQRFAIIGAMAMVAREATDTLKQRQT